MLKCKRMALARTPLLLIQCFQYTDTSTPYKDMLAGITYLPSIPSLLSISYLLIHTKRTQTRLHTPYHAEQHDSCPPSVNVIHEEMEIWGHE